MQTFDLTPLFRHSVGFDRMQRLLNASARMETSANTYPPYNIVQSGEDTYRITVAVAGFSEQDLDITAKENTLIISGKNSENADEKPFLRQNGAVNGQEHKGVNPDRGAGQDILKKADQEHRVGRQQPGPECRPVIDRYQRQ